MASLGKTDFVTRLEDMPGWQAGNVLDVRSTKAFEDGHLRGSTSHPREDPDSAKPGSGTAVDPVPSIFLPPRHEPLLVVASRQDVADRLAVDLAARNRAQVDGLALPDRWMGDLPAAVAADLVRTGTSNHFLWQPPRWLARHADLLPPPMAGEVLDLACGSGRAAVWLAARGYRVTGIDWQPEALALGRTLAASRSVTCQFLEGDLRQVETIPRGPWAVVLNFRFRQTDLLEMMPHLLQPAGVALVRTFRSEPGYDGHPSPRHRLARGELLRYFPAGCCEILAHEESHDPDGRPAAGIVARKKS